RDVRPAADDIGTPGIEQSAVPIAPEQIHILPWVFRRVGFVCAEVKLAAYVVFPCHPRHDAVTNAIMVDHVAGPASEIVASNTVTAVCVTCLIPPQLLSTPQLRVVARAVYGRCTVIPMRGFTLETIYRGRPDIHDILPLRV